MTKPDITPNCISTILSNSNITSNRIIYCTFYNNNDNAYMTLNCKNNICRYACNMWIKTSL